MGKIKVNIEINGFRYTLGGEEEEAYYQRLGQHVDRQIREIKRVYSHINDMDAAIMAALNISDELIQLRQEHEELKKHTERMTTVEAPFVEEPLPAPELAALTAPKDAFIPQKNKEI